MSEKHFDIAAFEVPKHKSLLYKMFLTKETLLKAVEEAIEKNANVISIRQVSTEEAVDAKKTETKPTPSSVAPEPSTFEIRGKDGSQLAIGQSTSESITVEPTVTLKADLPVFKNFLVPRVLKPISEKYGGSYRLVADSQGFLTEISLRDTKLDEKQVKELTSATRWALERGVEAGGT